MPPVMVAIAPMPSLPTLPKAPPILVMSDPLLLVDALSTASPMSPSMLLPNPFPEGSTWTYATPMSCAIMLLHLLFVGIPMAVGIIGRR